MDKRQLKNLLYEQVARIGKAVASPKRLELLELLAQGDKSVEQLAQELSIDIKLVSAHLRTLREARLVTFRKEGTFAHYQLTGDDVAGLWVKMHEVAGEHLIELRMALDHMVAEPSKLLGMDRNRLLHSAQRGDVVVIDVRPRAEYERAHRPFHAGARNCQPHCRAAPRPGHCCLLPRALLLVFRRGLPAAHPQGLPGAQAA
jgi:DNA-binding transcriptional ArsR family regulator